MTAPDDPPAPGSGIDLANFTVVMALTAALHEAPNGSLTLFQRLPEHAAKASKTRRRSQISDRIAAYVQRMTPIPNRPLQGGPR